MPRPSEVAKPITTARPEELGAMSAEWASLADGVRAQRERMQSINGQVRNTWSGDAADSFGGYADELMTSLEQQEKALSEVSPVLAAMQDCTLQAQRDWEDFIRNWAIAWIAAIAPAILVAIGLLLSPDPVTKVALILFVLGLVLALILGFLFALLNWLVARQRQRADCLEQRRKKMDRLGKRGEQAARIRAINPPSDPVITSEGFSSIRMPAALSTDGRSQ